MCPVFENTLYLTCELMEDSALQYCIFFYQLPAQIEAPRSCLLCDGIIPQSPHTQMSLWVNTQGKGWKPMPKRLKSLGHSKTHPPGNGRGLDTRGVST